MALGGGSHDVCGAAVGSGAWIVIQGFGVSANR